MQPTPGRALTGQSTRDTSKAKGRGVIGPAAVLDGCFVLHTDSTVLARSSAHEAYEIQKSRQAMAASAAVAEETRDKTVVK